MRHRLTYANVMATLAFFFALTGGTMAATKYLTASDPITQGDLAGSTYGNPVIAAGKVTTGKIADGAVTGIKLAPLPTPTAIALEDEWTWRECCSAQPSFYVDSQRVCHLTGAVSGGGSGNVSTLPAPCRPASSVAFAVPTIFNGTDDVEVRVDPDGSLVAQNRGDANIFVDGIYLDGVSFRTN